MATGEQEITLVGGWQEVTGATGAIILQNHSPSYSLQYFIGTAAPSSEHGVNLRPLDEHTPNIRANESLYARSQNADVTLAWSE